MADTKKKNYILKETNGPQRPMILKSDRDATKEASKEKQPTIILKTREQSTTKEDRPLSPKATEPDQSVPTPSKIVQNENKEKKEQKLSMPLKPMSEPIKLLDENLEFNNAALEFLLDSSSNYLVVGILGTQGVGKSMILNLLIENTFNEELRTNILNSHQYNDEDVLLDSDDSVVVENQMETLSLTEGSESDVELSNCANSFKFKMQNLEQIERGVHCTKGVDMYVTENRVILLDCQALWSPSLIEESANPVAQRNSNVIVVDCLQIASFLMLISHVVIAVQDWFTDYNFIRYIQAAEMLKPSLSAHNNPTSLSEYGESSNGAENNPHLLLLHNRCNLEDYLPETVRIMQDFYKAAFEKSNLQLKSGMYLYSELNKNGVNVESVCKGYTVDKCGSPINLFLLPEVPEKFCRDVYRGHPTFEAMAKRLRWMIMGVNKHQITNVPNLTERGWFHYCSKTWETVRKCTFFMEYERFLP